MATRTIEDINERRLTIILSPFMPCGAKMAVFGWLSTIFFNGNPFVATSMYFLSVIVIAVCGKILQRKIIKNSTSNFILEMPTLRLPQLKTILRVALEKIKDFSVKAGTIIFAVSICMWFLKNFGFSGYVEEAVEKSFLAIFGNLIKWIFYPLGFSSWQSSVSLLSGILAKEAVAESLMLLSNDITSLFATKYSIYAYMSFILLMPPCIATLSVAKKELKSKKWFAFMIIFQCLVAYTTSFLVNLIGEIICRFGCLIFLIIVAIIVVAVKIIIKASKKGCCCCGRKICKNCKMENQS